MGLAACVRVMGKELEAMMLLERGYTEILVQKRILNDKVAAQTETTMMMATMMNMDELGQVLRRRRRRWQRPRR